MKNKEKSKYIFMIIAILLALAGMVTYNFVTFYSTSATELENMGRSILAQETEQLNGYLTKGMDVLQVTAITVEYMMKEDAPPEKIENFLTTESERYKQEIDENFTGIYGVFNGNYIDGIGWVPGEGYVPQEREWYIAAEKAKGRPTIVSPYLDAQTNTVMISVSQLLYDNESVISLDIALNEIQIITENINLNEIGYGFVVDKDGLIVAHNDENEKGKNYSEDEEYRELIKNIYSQPNGNFEMYILGEKCTVFKSTVMNDWFVAMIISNTKLFEDLRMILFRNIMVCIIVFMIILLFCMIAFRHITMSMKIKAESEKKLATMNENIIRALARTIDAKDRYTNGHSQRVANYAVELAKRMGKNKQEQMEVYYSGLLHDVGKIRVPGEIINKPGKLNDYEFEQIKMHPITGYYVLKDIYENKRIAEGARHHHERYDGKGYPNRLKGEDIPEIARIIGVADSYDAMASDRSYRNALPQDVVRREIENGKGTQFDPHIADIMLEMIDNDSEYTMKQAESTRRTILIVDSDKENIAGLEVIMEDDPMYHILSALNGRQAMEIMDKNTVDLVFLDSELSDTDVFDMLEKIKNEYGIPVIAMISKNNINKLHRFKELNIDDYLTKPFSSLALKEMVHSVLNN